ncbi:MAG: hypothetical protein KAI47_14460 [Deltaproteobacteria bacterium]|nr:hypothetical protein [Deltaproteobacteria bacterium]
MNRTARSIALLVLLSHATVGCSDFVLAGPNENRQAASHVDGSTLVLIDGSTPEGDAGVPAAQGDSTISRDAGVPQADTSKPLADTSAPQAATSKPPTGSCGNAFESEVFNLVNAERAKIGLTPLACAVDAGAAARAYSALMCTQRFFSHQGLNGSSPQTRLADAGVSFHGCGENIAAGQQTPASVMNGWMHSSGHRANILRTSFTHIGIGYVKCPGGKMPTYWTQEFLSR